MGRELVLWIVLLQAAATHAAHAVRPGPLRLSFPKGHFDEPPLMELVLLQGTHCLDGSRAGYYFRKAASSRGETRWVIYFEGGGLCYDPQSCQSRAKTNLGSSDSWGLNRTGGNSLAVDSARNPDFWDANHVFVPYCTGDL